MRRLNYEIDEQAFAKELEGLVDKTSLHMVLDVLADIAREKAEHIRCNWQDEPLARSWSWDGGKLERTASKLEN